MKAKGRKKEVRDERWMNDEQYMSAWHELGTWDMGYGFAMGELDGFRKIGFLPFGIRERSKSFRHRSRHMHT